MSTFWKSTDELCHHGILNQRWGHRNGPPYPLRGGQYSKSEKKAIRKKRKLGNSIYNKKHFDEVIDKAKTLTTLSYDKDRTKKSGMFYAAHNALDKHQYNALFNKRMPRTLYDTKGNAVGTGKFLKYRIDSSLKHNIKVASEDSGAEVFRNMYQKDRDFYNFVTDKNRMQSYFDTSKYKFKGYRESAKVLNKMRAKPGYIPSSDDLQKVYRMYNYTIPYDGGGDKRKEHDAALQRAKFFKECKNRGYGALLDTNDSIYGGYKTRSSVIVFDTDAIMSTKVRRTTIKSKQFSKAVTAYRKLLGV